MGDVTLILNKTSDNRGGREVLGGGGGRGKGGGGGGADGDDEDTWTEASGSGDGEDKITHQFSSKPPVRSSDRMPSAGRRDTGAESQENLIMYIVSAVVIFAVIVIVVVIVVMCYRRRSKARRTRLSSQVSEMKTMGLNKETRVFRNIASGNTLDRQSNERFLPPPSMIAPPPPTSSKARVAPEAEKLLQAGSSSSAPTSAAAFVESEVHPEFKYQSSVEDYSSHHVYEEIPSSSNPQGNGNEGVHKLDKSLTAARNCQDNGKIQDKNVKSKHHENSHPVAKPRKSLEVIDGDDETEEDYLEARVMGSAV